MMSRARHALPLHLRPRVLPHTRAFTLAHSSPLSRRAITPLHDASQRRFQSGSAPLPTESPQSDLEPLLDPDAPVLSSLSRGDDRHVGYLYENYGLDFGWGFTTTVKYLFENIHSFGSEYWVSVLLTGLSLRLLLVPFNRISSDQSERMRAISHLLKPHQQASREAALKKDYAAMQKARASVKQLQNAAGARNWKILFFSFLQIPFGFGSWRLFRNMTDARVDGLSEGGAMWFPDLTVADPYYVIPFIAAAAQFVGMRVTMNANAASATPSQAKLQKNLGYFMSAVFLPFISFQPALIQLHFLTTSLCAATVNTSFTFNSVRSFLAMSPRAQPPPKPEEPRTISVSARSSSSATASASAAASAAAAPGPKLSLGQRIRKWSESSTESLATTMSETVGGGMPIDKKSRTEKAAKDKARAYELKRSKEVAKQREAFVQQKRAEMRDRQGQHR